MIKGQESYQEEIIGEWNPKPPRVEIIFTYDKFDLPQNWLQQQLTRDEHIPNLLLWEPTASSRSLKDAVDDLLRDFRESFLHYGFTQLKIGGNIFDIETGLIVPK